MDDIRSDAVSLGAFISQRLGARSHADLAEQIGVYRQTVHSWVTNKKAPTPEHLEMILECLGASDEDRLEAWRLRAAWSPVAPHGGDAEPSDGAA